MNHPNPGPGAAGPAPRPHAGRRAVAIPLVMGFCFLATVFVFMMSTIRVEDKRQNLMTFQQLKAYYLAQAAIQHALLKVRILPNEVYDASALARGLCPFVVDPPDDQQGTQVTQALDEFVEDINTESGMGMPLTMNTDPEQQGWSYRIESARALTTFTRADSDDSAKARKVNVIEFHAIGTIQDKLVSHAGGSNAKERQEKVVKVVEITRSSK